MTRTLLLSLTGLALVGCVEDLGTLSRLQDAYGDQTVGLIEPALYTTLALGALSADTCVAVGEGRWSDLDIGQALPIADELAVVFGAPLVESHAVGTTIELVLSPVDLAGEEAARLLLTVVPGSPAQVSGSLTDATGATNLGSFRFEVAGDCSKDWSRISGDASWVIDDLEHDLVLPAEASGTSGLDWPGVVPWLPSGGVLGWQGRVDGELRSFQTEDASEIEPYGTGGLWTGAVSGREWSTTVTADLQP